MILWTEKSKRSDTNRNSYANVHLLTSNLFCLIQTRAQRASAMDKRLRSNIKSRKRKTALKNSYGPQLLRPGLHSNGRGTYVRILDNYVIYVFLLSVQKSKLLQQAIAADNHKNIDNPVKHCVWHSAREKVCERVMIDFGF